MKLRVVCERGCGVISEFESAKEMQEYLASMSAYQVGIFCPVCKNLITTYMEIPEPQEKKNDPLST